jgi:hypothetical protein
MSKEQTAILCIALEDVNVFDDFSEGESLHGLCYVSVAGSDMEGEMLGLYSCFARINLARAASVVAWSSRLVLASKAA